LGKADRTARILIAEAERTLPRSAITTGAGNSASTAFGAETPESRLKRRPSARSIPGRGVAPGYLMVITISWRITASPKMTGQKTQPETSGLNVFSVLMIPFSSVLCSMTASLPGLA
jgi:hypothetical protein